MQNLQVPRRRVQEMAGSGDYANHEQELQAAGVVTQGGGVTCRNCPQMPVAIPAPAGACVSKSA